MSTMNVMTAPTLPAIFDRFLEVVAVGDTEGLLDLFTAAGSVTDWGHSYAGRDSIRAWSDREFIGAQVTLHASKVVEVDGRVTVKATVGGLGFNGPSTFVLVTAGDQLRELIITA